MNYVDRRTFVAAITVFVAGCKESPGTSARNKVDADRTLISDEEFKTIHDPASRKPTADGMLVVQDRLIGDDRCRLDKVTIENVHFINCRFLEHLMFDVELKNVRFTNCGFANVRWEGGKWSGLNFFDCGFIDNAIRIGTSEGTGTSVFEKCVFEGSDPSGDIRPDSMRLYGTFAGPGDSRYVECVITRFEFGVDRGATFVNCLINWIWVHSLHESGGQKLVFENCNAGYAFQMDNCAIDTVEFKNSTFPAVDARKLTASRVAMTKSKGCFDFFGSDITDFRASDCIFNHAKDADDSPTGLGLSLAWIDAQSVSLERCRFEGRFSRLFASGAEPDRLPDGKIKYHIDKSTGKPIDPYAKMARLRLVDTPLDKGEMGYCHIGDFEMQGARLADVKITHSAIGRLTLTDVQLAGKLDFTDTQVTKTVSSGLTKADVTIVRDKKTQLDLSA